MGPIPTSVSEWEPLFVIIAAIVDIAVVVGGAIVWFRGRWRAKVDRLALLNGILRQPPRPGKTPARQAALFILLVVSFLAVLIVGPFAMLSLVLVNLGIWTLGPSVVFFTIAEQAILGVAVYTTATFRKRALWWRRQELAKAAEERYL